jgi:Transposase DDE domain
MINIEQIKSILVKLPIQELGYSSGFIKISEKITAVSFVLSFFESFSQGGKLTTSSWAINLSHFIGEILTKQGLNKRIGWNCLYFCQQILQSSLSYSLNKRVGHSNEHVAKPYFKHFSQVILEDSTCLKLPKLLYSIYGGGANQHENYAVCRIQLRFDLFTHYVKNLCVTSYAQNDVSFARDIVDQICENCLIIRDLGYFSLDVFEVIAEKGAYYLSRWHPNTKLVCSITKKVVEMEDLLKKATKAGLTVVDMTVLLGIQKQLPCRLVALKVPQEVESKRYEAALKKQKSKSITYSASYFELLGWTIYITNVPKDKLSCLDILNIYALRWRIEIIFKAWKSHLNFLNYVNSHDFLNPCQVMVRLYLILAWITLCLVPAYNYFQAKIYQTEKRFLSLAKFTDYYRKNFQKFVNELEWDMHIPFLKAFCLYEKRKNSKNYFENLYMLNSC